MRHIAITGATSFLGIQIIKKLLQIDCKVSAVVRPQSEKTAWLPKSDKLVIIEADMSDYDTLDRRIDEPVDTILLMAWKGTRGAERMNMFMQETNYVSSMNSLRAALRLGCTNIITAGSQAEYGVHHEQISENTACNPNTDYGRFKLKLFYDGLDQCQKYGAALKEPRFFSVYGPGDFENTMVISTLRKMIINEDCSFTEATQIWDFLYCDDAAEAVISLMSCECEPGAYNVASGIAKPLRYYIEDMRRLSMSTSRLLFGEVPYTAAGKINIWADITKITNRTGWKPKTDFEDGIMKVISYCKGTEKHDN